MSIDTNDRIDLTTRERELKADADALRAALTEIVRLNSRREDADVQQATRDAATAFAQSVKIARAALDSVLLAHTSTLDF